QPRPPTLGPGLGEQGCADRPLAADAERRQEAEDQQLPPRLSEVRQPRERRVGEDGQHEGPAASKPTADDAEEAAAKSPANKKRRLDPGAVVIDPLVFLIGDAQKLG